MKRLFTIILITISSFILLAQKETNVPKNIKFKFFYEHPGAKNVLWSKVNKVYTVKYKENDKELTVFYEQNGDCVEIDRELYETELPQNFKAKLVEKLGTDYTLMQLVSVDDFGGSPYYLAKAQHKTKKTSIYFMLEGKNEILLYDIRQGVVVW